MYVATVITYCMTAPERCACCGETVRDIATLCEPCSGDVFSDGQLKRFAILEDGGDVRGMGVIMPSYRTIVETVENGSTLTFKSLDEVLEEFAGMAIVFDPATV